MELEYASAILGQVSEIWQRFLAHLLKKIQSQTLHNVMNI